MTTKTKESGKQSQQEQKQQRLLKTIRLNAIAASIWRRQTSTGFEYLDFSLSRSWKLKSGEKEGYSSNFFEQNEEAMLEVIRMACEYIRNHQQASSQQASDDENALANAA